MINKPTEQKLIACQQCDALFEQPRLTLGQQAECCRCGETLIEYKAHAIERTFALSIAGLLLIIPAMILPILGVSLAGQTHQASLFNCILVLIDKGFYFIATLVFVFVIAVPIVRLIGACYLAYSLLFNKTKPFLLGFFRTYNQLGSWSMLHVFLLGIVVAMYKLVDDMEITIHYGLLAFVLLLICSTLVSVNLDKKYVWDTLEQACDNTNS